MTGRAGRVGFQRARVEALDWDRLCGMFANSGYRGYIALEYEEKEAPETAVVALA